MPARCIAVSPKTSYPPSSVGDGHEIPEAVKPLRLVVARIWVSAIDEVSVCKEDELLDAEDVEPMRTIPIRELPSRSEIEKHRIDHWPRRNWCDEIV